MKFTKRVWEICKKIPKGKVSTYGELAKALDTKAYQAVGSAMRRNIYAPVVPCHRVVAKDGSLYAFEGKKKGPSLDKKRRMLEEEGVTFIGSKVDMEKHFHRF